MVTTPTSAPCKSGHEVALRAAHQPNSAVTTNSSTPNVALPSGESSDRLEPARAGCLLAAVTDVAGGEQFLDRRAPGIGCEAGVDEVGVGVLRRHEDSGSGRRGGESATVHFADLQIQDALASSRPGGGG